MVIWLKVPTRVNFFPTIYMSELKKFQPFSPGQPESRQGLPGKRVWPGLTTVFM